jgi:flagellar biosynthesis protein FliR
MDLAFVTRLGLMLVRPGLLIAAAPPFGALYTPAPVKIGLSVVLAIVLAPSVDVPATAGIAPLAVILAREAAIGFALALSVRVLMAGAELAGQLAGFQLGFAYAAAVDPQTGARNSTVGALYTSLALLTFLGVDGHHTLLRALAQSYRDVPVGLGHVGSGMAAQVGNLLGLLFVFGTQVASPVVIVLLVAEVATGLVARVAPALNMMVIGFPVRLIAGLIALAATVGAVPAVVSRLLVPALEMAGRLAYSLR